MMGGEAFEETGDPCELIAWNGIWNDEHSIMRTPVIEELEGEIDEVISIPGNQTPLLSSGKLQLQPISRFKHPHFMNAQRIDPVAPEHFSNLRTQVFIQIEFQV